MIVIPWPSPPFNDEPQDQDVPPPFDRQDPPQPEIPGEEFANVEYGYHQYTDMILDDVQDRLLRGIDNTKSFIMT